MRSKRKAVVLLLVVFLAVILLLLVSPGLRKSFRGFRSNGTSGQARTSLPSRTPALPHSPPSYLPLADLPVSIKKQALAVELAVKGRVMNTQGEGIPGTRVQLALHEQLELNPPAIAEALTDAQGYYQLGIQPVAALASLTAEKEGYTPGRVSLDLQGETGSVERNLILMRAEASLSGRVTDTQGGPVPNAKIGFRSQDNAAKQYTSSFSSGSSGKNGDYLLTNLSTGRCILTVRAPGYSFKTSQMELEAGENKADLQLENFPTFFITVKNRQGEPVKYPRAYVSAARPSQMVGFGDESGLIDVPLTPQLTSLDWEVRAIGYRSANVSGNPKGGKADVTLEDGPVISGVVMSQSGRPIPRALVVAGCRGANGGFTRTDSDGRFSMNTGCTAQVFVEASCPGYVTRGLRLAAEALKQDLLIKLQEPDGGISGWILHRDGRPVKRALLQLMNENPEEPFSITRSLSDPEGRFAILDLPAGQLELQVTAADQVEGQPPLSPETFPVKIRKGMVYTDLVIRLNDQPLWQE